MLERKPEVSDLIRWRGINFKVCGDDTLSEPHPSGAFKKWEYLLKNLSTGKDEFVTKEMLLQFQNEATFLVLSESHT